MRRIASTAYEKIILSDNEIVFSLQNENESLAREIMLIKGVEREWSNYTWLAVGRNRT